ncbi:MAG: 2,3-bisphosphoglycerate-independent phosphoglycerate mutase [Candidatus Komeilibacteria bacterium]|nr:2,3-bisphosphoglycerate-independent phosphoglycerate mutase [Candidatus Komeilibacteria bacterium]
MAAATTLTRPRPLVLVVLDGWGIAPPSRANAISLARTPNMDSYLSSYPSMSIQAGGESVGLSWGEIGNSEVGHLSLGSGRVMYQSLPRISKAIAEGRFFKNQTLLQLCKTVQQRGRALHLMGLVSSGGVHSYNEHLYALLELAAEQKLTKVYIHCFLDGRDTPLNSGLNFITKLQDTITKLGVGAIASVSGRFYAMDRDNHWERIAMAYNAIVKGESEKKSSSPLNALKESYANQVYDEQVYPTVITSQGKAVGTVTDGDGVIFFNFRADRARQMTKAFVLPGFEKFPREYLKDVIFVTMTEYEKDLPVEVAFPPEVVTTPLAKVLSDAGLTQLHIAETEKYAHATYFFNGGQEVRYKGEDHVLIPSIRVPSYDQKPAMSAREITARVIAEIRESKYDFIVINFANADMVGHTGNLEATIAAVEILDDAIGQIVETVKAYDGAVLITADHGNAETMFNLQTGVIDKMHSNNPVPFIIIGKRWEGKNVTSGVRGVDLSGAASAGILSDVTATILKILGIQKPDEMIGTPLI